METRRSRCHILRLRNVQVEVICSASAVCGGVHVCFLLEITSHKKNRIWYLALLGTNERHITHITHITHCVAGSFDRPPLCKEVRSSPRGCVLCAVRPINVRGYNTQLGRGEVTPSLLCRCLRARQPVCVFCHTITGFPARRRRGHQPNGRRWLQCRLRPFWRIHALHLGRNQKE